MVKMYTVLTLVAAVAHCSSESFLILFVEHLLAHLVLGS